MDVDKPAQCAILCLAAVLLGVYLYLSCRTSRGPIPPTAAFSVRGLTFVEVAGDAARVPGLYAFRAAPTVRAVIERAGGSKADGRFSPEELSREVTSGTKVLLGCSAGQVRFVRMGNAECLLLGIGMPLDTASADDVQLIPGVGPKLASRIIDFRTRNGAICSLADLERVDGIGRTTAQRMAPYLSLRTDAGDVRGR